MFWSAGCSLLRAEGFSCSLGVLYGGLGISKWQFLIKNIKIKFPAVNLFQFISNPGSGSAIRKNVGSGSALNRCGSETLSLGINKCLFFIKRKERNIPLYFSINFLSSKRSDENFTVGSNGSSGNSSAFQLKDLTVSSLARQEADDREDCEARIRDHPSALRREPAPGLLLLNNLYSGIR